MAQLSAYFLLGPKERFFNRSDRMFMLNLYEDDRIEPEIEPYYIYRPQPGKFPHDDLKIFPHLDYLYEDGVLIVGGLFLKDERIFDAIERYKENGETYDFRKIPLAERESLYARLKEITPHDKRIHLTCLYQSTLTKTLKEQENPFPYVELFFSNHIW